MSTAQSGVYFGDKAICARKSTTSSSTVSSVVDNDRLLKGIFSRSASSYCPRSRITIGEDTHVLVTVQVELDCNIATRLDHVQYRLTITDREKIAISAA
jgi:hypothetical protein